MLNAQEKNQISVIYASTCKAFDKVVEPDVLKMIVEDLSDLDFLSIVRALNKYRNDEKSVTWPRVGKIRALAGQKLSTETLANEAASRIREAIGKFGWCNGLEAEKFIGGLGWKVVERAGGWGYVCENHGLDLNPLTFHAQARDLAKSMIESNDAGNFDKPIQIEQKEVKNLIGNLIKEIPK